MNNKKILYLNAEFFTKDIKADIIKMFGKLTILSG